ncbi:hypothetical protein ACIBSW_19270 [Actinoplanes sp. NPDC049668]|uniref:hypothetical protein n=1 Tax=unclassified Actinoplanes TaxID=2626549 RepID=UPI0033AA1C6D
MFNYAPSDYVCPFCRLVAGGEDEWRTQRDVVRRDDLATAFVSPRWWPKNHGPQRDFTPAEQRLPYADKLRDHFSSN